MPVPSPPGPLDAVREREMRDAQASRYDRMLGLRLLTPVEVSRLLAPLPAQPGLRVLDVGCGTGRLTLPLLRRRARVVGVDFSQASLRVLRRKAASATLSPWLMQADARRLPLPDGWAQAVVSAQMLEHLPGATACRRALSEMARVLEPGAPLALSAYQRMPGLPVEGRHAGAIWFHRYRAAELRDLLLPWFTQIRVESWLGYVHVVHARRRAE